MSAHASDLRWFYSAVLGRAVSISAISASSTKVAEALTPGRYLVHFIDLTIGEKVWITQGPFASVVAAAAVPSIPLDADGIRAMEFTVAPGPTNIPAESSFWDGVAARTSGGTATVVITKISRDKR